MQYPSSSDDAPTLHLVCGKIGAGKSTLAQQLALRSRHVLIGAFACQRAGVGPPQATRCMGKSIACLGLSCAISMRACARWSSRRR